MSTMNFQGLSGIGKVLMVQSPRLPWVGKKTGPNPTDRAKRGTKRSLLTDGAGVPLSMVTSSAQTHDSKLFQSTLENMILEKPDGKHHICADKAFDSRAIRQLAEERDYRSHIKSRGDEKMEKKKNPNKKARRWVVERTHSWFNKFRRLLVRWEKKAANYEACLHLVSAIIAFKAAGVFG